MTELQARVIASIAEVLGVPQERVTPDAYLIEDLGADSLDAVELGLLLEEEYHIALDDEIILALITVQDLIKVVEQLSAQAEQEE